MPGTSPIINTRRSIDRLFPWLMLLLLLGTAGILSRVVGCDFLYWDDWKTIAQNPSFNPVSIEKVAGYWDPSKPHLSLYVPLTYTVWGITAALSPVHPPDENGITLSPAAFKAVNLTLHIASVLLVFAILRRLAGARWPAFFGAGLFAVHPGMVEAVAWTSGTKDLLSACLCLAATLEYCRFCTDGRPALARRRDYVIAVVLFVLAMLAKPSAVSLPLLLWVIDWTLLRRDWRKALRQLSPWLLGSLVIILIGRSAQPAFQTADVPLWARPFIAGDAIAFYVRKLFWPVDLVIDYGRNPYWLLEQGTLMYRTTALAMLLVIVALLLKRRFPWLLAGVGILIAATLPVLGFISFEFEWYSTVADHYVYLAMLGAAVIFAGALHILSHRAGYFLAAGLLAVLSWRTVIQTGYWQDMTALRNHLIAVNPQSPAAFHGAAYILANKGQFTEALTLYQQALNARPDFGMTHFDMANALMKGGFNLEDAIEHYRLATKYLPNDPDPPMNLGVALYRLKRFDEAEQAFSEAVRRKPDSPAARANLGQMYLMSDRLTLAEEEFRKALSLNPDEPAAVKGMADLRRLRSGLR